MCFTWDGPVREKEPIFELISGGDDSYYSRIILNKSSKYIIYIVDGPILHHLWCPKLTLKSFS